MRAAHLAGPGPYVFEDPWAVKLTSASYRELAESGELAEFFSGFGVLPIMGQILGRARWAEDALEASLDAGVGQFVDLGAGLDSFALRRIDLLPRLEVFELDHPHTQGYKLARLRELGVKHDPRVHYVAIDFERESVDVALARTAFDTSVPSFVTWLGVITYRTHDDVLRTLARLRRALAVGSRIALDYPIAPEQLTGEDRALFETIREGSAGLGEPRHPRPREAARPDHRTRLRMHRGFLVRGSPRALLREPQRRAPALPTGAAGAVRSRLSGSEARTPPKRGVFDPLAQPFLPIIPRR